MLDLILTTIITSLFCCGLHFITRDGWVLAPLDYFLVERLGGRITYSFSEQIMDEERKVYWKREWLGEVYKPLLGCIVCMGSIWGILGGLLFGVDLYLIPILCVIVAALNGIIYFNLLKHWE